MEEHDNAIEESGVVANLPALSLQPANNMAEQDTTPTLAGLPSEVLREIFSHLSRDIPTLFRIALVSRKFRDETQPIIYRNIDRSFWRQAALDHFWGEDTAKPSVVGQIFKIFDRNPTLCPLVRRLDLESFENVVADAQKRLLPLFSKIQDVSLAIFLPILHFELPHAMHLKSLAFNLQDDDDDEELWSTADREEALRLIARHLNIPSLRHISIGGLRGNLTNLDKLLPPSRYGTSLITSLTFYGYEHETLCPVSSILKTVKVLNYLELSLTSVLDNQDNGTSITPGSEFSSALQQHRDTIEGLLIIAGGGMHFDENFRLPELACFRKLRHLVILESFLISPSQRGLLEFLPQSLEELRLDYKAIHDDNGERSLRLARMQNLLDNLDKAPPLLKKIVWWEPEGTGKDDQLEYDEQQWQTFRKFQDDFQTAGMEFVCNFSIFHYPFLEQR